LLDQQESPVTGDGEEADACAASISLDWKRRSPAMKNRAEFSDLTRYYGADRRVEVERIKTRLCAVLDADQAAR
jgi:hypothetical protein